MKYRAEIDGLRAVAVIPVILFHAGFEIFSGGFVGVDVFFVLSGYLITKLIADEIDLGEFSIIGFYERRARRILPALFLVMICSIPLAWILLLPSDFVDFSQSLVANPLFVANFLFWMERGYFGVANELKPLIHTWSLSVEEQFYVFFPILFTFVWKKTFLLYALLLCVILGSLVASYAVTKLHFDTAFYLLPTRAWELLLGTCAALFIRKDIKTLTYNKSINDVLSFLGLVLIIIAVVFFNESTPFPSIYALIPATGTWLVIVFSERSHYAKNILGTSVLVFLGLISYSAYLWHQPIFAFYKHSGLALSGSIVYLCLSVFSVFIGFLSWKYLEQPFRNRSYLARNTIFKLSIVCSAIFIALGSLGYFMNGFPNRYAAEDRNLLAQFIGVTDYTQRRFDDLELRRFSGNDKTKLLIIGDSFAKDLVNGIYENNLDARYELSTVQINSECGNLFLDFDFTENIPEKNRSRCAFLDTYDSKPVRDLLENSDEIWLASSWKPWVVELLPESVKNLNDTLEKPLYVFGLKSFGDISQKSMLDIPFIERDTFTQAPSAEVVELNKIMKNALPDEVFINVQEGFCESELSCRIFTDIGEIISYDGAHLTKVGAEIYGRLIATYVPGPNKQ
ncbi:MAG: acyltransferase [SAR202 cluster bacterium]|nr:acyltransferase [SAR202 cluster bacterium]